MHAYAVWVVMADEPVEGKADVLAVTNSKVRATAEARLSRYRDLRPCHVRQAVVVVSDQYEEEN